MIYLHNFDETLDKNTKGLYKVSTLNEINELIDSMHTVLPDERCKDETIICECFLVNAGDIRSLTETGMGISEVIKKLSMGNGCGSCLKSKLAWKNKI